MADLTDRQAHDLTVGLNHTPPTTVLTCRRLGTSLTRQADEVVDPH